MSLTMEKHVCSIVRNMKAALPRILRISSSLPTKEFASKIQLNYNQFLRSFVQSLIPRMFVL